MRSITKSETITKGIFHSFTQSTVQYIGKINERENKSEEALETKKQIAKYKPQT